MKRLVFLGLLLCALRLEAQTGPPTSTEDRPRLEIVFEGLAEYLEPGVRAALTAQRQRASPDLDDLLVDHLARRAEDQARQALQAAGFYRAKVQSFVEDHPPGWRLRLMVEPGPVARLRQVQVELVGPGREDPQLAAFMRRFPLVPGGPLVHAPYEDFKADWLRLARECGYLDAHFSQHRILVDPASDTADATLVLESGEPYAFGATTFTQEGEQRFDADLLEGFRPWQEGEPYRLSRLLELHRGLADTGYFAVIDVTPKPDPARHVVDVAVRLAARPRTRYAFGAGLGTDTGPRGLLEVERRYLNPRGDRLLGRLRASLIDSEAEAEYRRPWLGAEHSPRRDFLALAAKYTRESVADLERETLQLTASATEVKGDWRRQLSLAWLTESYRVEGEPEQRSRMLVPALRLAWRPPREARGGGWRLDLEARGALDALLSDTSLLQLKADAGLTLPVRAHDQWLLRGSLGTSWATDFAQVPLSLRYFAGGDLSVRGYGYKTLGPVNEEGKVIGGKHLVVLSAEYDWMVLNPWGVALFVDAGNAFDDGRITLKTGIGLGLRWRSPVGLIGLDLAHGLDNPEDRFRLHFSLGVEL